MRAEGESLEVDLGTGDVTVSADPEGGIRADGEFDGTLVCRSLTKPQQAQAVTRCSPQHTRH